MNLDTIENFQKWLLTKSKKSKNTSQQYAKLLKTTSYFDLETPYDEVFRIFIGKVNTTVSRSAHVAFIKYLKDTATDYKLKQHARVLSAELKDMTINDKAKNLTLDEVRYKVMTKDEVSTLYLAAQEQSKGIAKLQNLILLRMLYETAGRAEEVRRYEWIMLNFDDKTVSVPKEITKRNKYRVADFSEETRKLLIQYKTYLKENGMKQKLLFFNHKNYHSLYFFIKRISKKAMGKEVTPHWFRHTFATHTTVDALGAVPKVERSVVEEKIRQYLGHDDTKTTRIYTKLADTLKHERLLEQYGEVP